MITNNRLRFVSVLSGSADQTLLTATSMVTSYGEVFKRLQSSTLAVTLVVSHSGSLFTLSIVSSSKSKSVLLFIFGFSLDFKAKLLDQNISSFDRHPIGSHFDFIILIAA